MLGYYSHEPHDQLQTCVGWSCGSCKWYPNSVRARGGKQLCSLWRMCRASNPTSVCNASIMSPPNQSVQQSLPTKWHTHLRADRFSISKKMGLGFWNLDWWRRVLKSRSLISCEGNEENLMNELWHKVDQTIEQEKKRTKLQIERLGSNHRRKEKPVGRERLLTMMATSEGEKRRIRGIGAGDTICLRERFTLQCLAGQFKKYVIQLNEFTS